MHRCGISLFRDRLGLWLAFIVILMMASFMVHAFARFAQAQVPLEGQSEIIEKSLRQSLPRELPPEPKAPKITNKSKPSSSKAPAGGPTFFIKKYQPGVFGFNYIKQILERSSAAHRFKPLYSPCPDIIIFIIIYNLYS